MCQKLPNGVSYTAAVFAYSLPDFVRKMGSVHFGRYLLYRQRSRSHRALAPGRVLESYESPVIQEWWPDSRRGHRCGRAKTAPVTTAASCISERFDRRRMGTGRTADPAGQDWRWQAHGDHAGGGERLDVHSLDRLSVARDPERPAAEKLGLRLLRSVDI